MPADLVTLVVWRDAATQRPAGDMERRVLAIHPNTGAVVAIPAWMVDDRDRLWAELPVPPNADAPLTIKNVRRMCDLAWGTAISRADVTTIERLRAWLPKEEPSA